MSTVDLTVTRLNIVCMYVHSALHKLVEKLCPETLIWHPVQTASSETLLRNPIQKPLSDILFRHPVQKPCSETLFSNLIQQPYWKTLFKKRDLTYQCSVNVREQNSEQTWPDDPSGATDFVMTDSSGHFWKLNIYFCPAKCAFFEISYCFHLHTREVSLREPAHKSEVSNSKSFPIYVVTNLGLV